MYLVWIETGSLLCGTTISNMVSTLTLTQVQIVHHIFAGHLTGPMLTSPGVILPSEHARIDGSSTQVFVLPVHPTLPSLPPKKCEITLLIFSDDLIFSYLSISMGSLTT